MGFFPEDSNTVPREGGGRNRLGRINAFVEEKKGGENSGLCPRLRGSLGWRQESNTLCEASVGNLDSGRRSGKEAGEKGQLFPSGRKARYNSHDWWGEKVNEDVGKGTGCSMSVKRKYPDIGKKKNMFGDNYRVSGEREETYLTHRTVKSRNGQSKSMNGKTTRKNGASVGGNPIELGQKVILGGATAKNYRTQALYWGTQGGEVLLNN